jgi:uncharacterized protein (TIGR02444 family)
MSNSSQNFWEFSLDLYNCAEVSAACLDLQNQHGIDVNLLLLCCWYGAQVGELSETSLNQALAYSNQWAENVVKPLRQTRVWMKSNMPNDQNQQMDFQEVRNEIKAVELRAEKHQQVMLEVIAMSQPNAEAQGKSTERVSPEKAIERNVLELINQMKVADSLELTATLSLVIAAAAAN